jgi:hypothetical protein
MSIPINHHHVSQCQSKKFFNKADKKIYILDRETLEITWKESTKTLFSEKDSNTRTIDGVTIDRETLEKDLSLTFEDHYPRHVAILEALADNPENPPANFSQAYAQGRDWAWHFVKMSAISLAILNLFSSSSVYMPH